MSQLGSGCQSLERQQDTRPQFLFSFTPPPFRHSTWWAVLEAGGQGNILVGEAPGTQARQKMNVRTE